MTDQPRHPGAAPPTERDRVQLVDTLLDQLFDDPDLPTWAILDGARIERLVREIEAHEIPHACLFAGALDPSMARVAPYLVRLDETDPFCSWLLGQGWGKSWGIYLRSEAPRMALRRHLRRLLQVKGPDGESLLFRYYDPRVLRVYLPTCNDDELASVFGPLAAILTESEDGSELLRFSPGTAPATAERIGLSRRSIGS